MEEIISVSSGGQRNYSRVRGKKKKGEKDRGCGGRSVPFIEMGGGGRDRKKGRSSSEEALSWSGRKEKMVGTSILAHGFTLLRAGEAGANPFTRGQGSSKKEGKKG